MDLVNDSAIRHANGKQVARWNVDISAYPEAAAAAAAAAASTSAGPQRPNSTHQYNNARHPNGKAYLITACVIIIIMIQFLIS